MPYPVSVPCRLPLVRFVELVPVSVDPVRRGSTRTLRACLRVAERLNNRCAEPRLNRTPVRYTCIRGLVQRTAELGGNGAGARQQAAPCRGVGGPGIRR